MHFPVVGGSWVDERGHQHYRVVDPVTNGSFDGDDQAAAMQAFMASYPPGIFRYADASGVHRQENPMGVLDHADDIAHHLANASLAVSPITAIFPPARFIVAAPSIYQTGRQVQAMIERHQHGQEITPGMAAATAVQAICVVLSLSGGRGTPHGAPHRPPPSLTHRLAHGLGHGTREVGTHMAEHEAEALNPSRIDVQELRRVLLEHGLANNPDAAAAMANRLVEISQQEGLSPEEKRRIIAQTLVNLELSRGQGGQGQ
jgi:hypothetical protein